MSDSQLRSNEVLSSEDVTRRGQQWFEQKIRSLVADHPTEECVAIDVLTGEFATAAEPLLAIEELRIKQPNAVIWTRRVGSEIMHRFGIAPRPRPVELRRVRT